MHPDELWENFKDALSEDFLRLYGHRDRAYNLTYSIICETLITEGLSYFPSMHQMAINNLIEDDNESRDNLGNICNRQYNMLNHEQKGIVDMILRLSNVIEYNNSSYFYIDGPGGPRKTFIYTTLDNFLKSQNKNVCCMAFTGIAAILLPKRMPVHKVLGLPVPLLSDSSERL